MRKYSILVVVAFTFIFVLSCSKDEKVVAECKLGKSNFTLKLKDIKNEFLNYALYDQSLVDKDLGWYKDVIKYRYLMSEMRYADLIEKGITNNDNFKKDYERLKRNIYDGALIRKGQSLIMEKSKGARYKVARASHILLLVPRYKEVSNKQVEKSADEFEQEMKEAETKAKNIIESLKSSKNVAKEFAKTAKEVSKDPGSAANGGDLGYFTEGTMIKEFEDAVFSAKKAGVISEPVKTTYGFHVVYVTDPAKERTLSEIKSKIPGNTYQRLERTLAFRFQDADQQKNVKELFTLDVANKKITTEGKNYDVKGIPDEAKILSVYGKTYTWGECKEVISFYVPMFLEKLDINSFEEQMGNLKRFLYFRDIAKSQNYEKTKEFEKDYKDNLDRYTKNLVTQSYDNELLEKVKSQITEKDLRSFYNNNKQKFTKEEKGKKIVSKFEDVKSNILNQIASSNVQAIKAEWDKELEQKYRITFNDSAIRALISMERGYIDKFRKAQKQKQQEQKKK
ncbi:MAG: peptidylprolyl isomerase [Brevinematia bacterium]